MAKKRQELTQTCKNLLEYSAGDLIPILAANKNLLHVKQSGFDFYNKETEEHYQVQVLVTRNESDFLEAFETLEMSSF